MNTKNDRNCPTCKSPQPHLHPATSAEGEVHTCPDDFHLRPTPQNTDKYIKLVHEEKAWRDAHAK